MLASPSGTDIQFRYTDDLIPTGLQQQFESRMLDGITVLLGYIDYNQNDADGYHPVLPLRYARLVETARVGDVFILRFELEDFAVNKDLDTLQKRLPRETRHWDKASAKAVGVLCQELPDTFQLPERSTDIREWEKTIGELVKHSDFKDLTYFFNIRGVFARGDTTPVKITDGQYILNPQSDYELRLFYIDPNRESNSQKVQWLKVEAADHWLKVENPSISIDSPYDVTPVSLRTGDPGLHPSRTMLVLRDRESNQTVSDLPTALYVPLKVKGNFLKTLAYAIGLGILLTFQQLLAIFSTKEEKHSPKLVTVIAVMLGMLTGFFLAFGLAKPGG